ncbi:MAG: hypothetical protein D3904_13800, partial [Candidatus Electrothrix sp. EH2]|nr:hypothetical protein [Candidatus Electrothrix sp. EH2]
GEIQPAGFQDRHHRADNEGFYLFSTDSFHLKKRMVADRQLIGHNPAVTDFCNALSNSRVENVPTCGYVQLVVKEACRWQELAAGAAELAVLLRPKKLMR